MAKSLSGRTMFITGATRGIGRAIALAAAREGANVALLGKTDTPHRYLPGTVQEAAEAIEAAGGRALPVIADVRDDAAVAEAVARTVETFGGIDICVNNASAIDQAGVLDTDMKRFDLVHDIIVRGAFLVSKCCLPHLLRAPAPHLMMLAPRPNLDPARLGRSLHQSMAKYGIAMQVIGMAEEFRDQGVAVTGLWPRAGIATAAIEFRRGDEALRHCRKPEIMGDAAVSIFRRPAVEVTGRFSLDDEALHEAGVRDFSAYVVEPGQPLWLADWRRDAALPEWSDPIVPPPGEAGRNARGVIPGEGAAKTQ
ncbi:SDR family oxidoreductase [Frigidibacter albus]|uniref:SDR family oxidoreductase n=1 Tax=Frigidibacter albus TaxID=1465486 RepID=A0A6L8VP36_9RHOB|nr:SDR family oxidoreductase [Frigidibacter albus]MZQ91109.1 SDR family oxidoreductase [Frigidibacter albus]NBE32994.1 SDR family oxidoreductase [Frigidibacter albus]GGH62824.1 short chain dehydrogenase [Frigidibacter albus]